MRYLAVEVFDVLFNRVNELGLILLNGTTDLFGWSAIECLRKGLYVPLVTQIEH